MNILKIRLANMAIPVPTIIFFRCDLKIPSLSEVVVGYQSTAYLLNRFGIPGDRERKNIEYFVDSHGTALIPKS